MWFAAIQIVVTVAGVACLMTQDESENAYQTDDSSPPVHKYEIVFCNDKKEIT